MNDNISLTDLTPAAFPSGPGVYLMKDGAGRVVYVGKANNLRARVGAYLNRTDSRVMIPFLMSQVASIEFIVTETEKEALILENSLIKTHRPRYNVYFRDDKDYYHLRLSAETPYPRLELIRRPTKDGAKYFGPYPSSASARETLRFLQEILPLRTCRDREMKSRRRPCLEYAIKRCPAPCVGLVSPESYSQTVQDTATFLEGRVQGLLDDLKRRMEEAAQVLEFEQAARLRDRIAAIKHTLERQSVHALEACDHDVFGIYQDGSLSQVCVLFIRRGVLLEKRVFPLLGIPWDGQAVLEAVIKQYYLGGAAIPDEIILPTLPEDAKMFAELLRERRGRPVKIRRAARGRLRELLNLAQLNAEKSLKMQGTGADPGVIVQKLTEKLGLTREPRLIECYDISNLGGVYAVGVKVSFLNGLPWKEGYRRYRIKTVAGADDYGMMYEVLKRRLTGDKNGLARPDLIIVDGGKGHLAVALAVLKDLGVSGIDVIALAKESRRGGEAGGTKTNEERLYLPGRKNPLYPSRWPPLLLFLKRIRDEAHRFARQYHIKVKEKSDFASRLDLIPGIGPLRRKALLTHFNNWEEIAAASQDELQLVPGLGGKTAEQICAYFKGKPEV